jgi:FkbH-like protein
MGDKKNIKIAILSSFTLNRLPLELKKACNESKINADIYSADYNQYAQEILNEKSGLYRFKPDMIFIFVDVKTILGDLFYDPYGSKKEIWKKWPIDVSKNFSNLIGKLLNKTEAKIILHNFETPSYSPLGIVENKHKNGYLSAIEILDDILRKNYVNNDRVFIFDYNGFCSRIGKENIFDPKMYYLGDIKIAFKYLKPLSHEYLAYIIPAAARAKKCLVFDLDNTLWGGIIGEDGIEGIKLGPAAEGKPYLEFQKHILALYNRGLILAINSKNNPEDALKVFRQHPDMILKEDKFAATRINWQDKITNMKEIAAELNIGLDSFIFFDDDKANREMVKKYLPEVETVDMPEDPSLYSSVLFKINSFNTFHITEEDTKRNEMYLQDKKRTALKSTVQNLEEFISSLKLKISVMKADKFTIPRISQLTLKTNQFNVTTRRYSEGQIQNFIRSGQYFIRCYQVTDKFGDYGITGVAIIKHLKDQWLIDSFLLSCRVLGKNVELAIMGSLIKEAKNKKIKRIISEFVPTAKNKPAENFYQDCKFSIIEKSGGRTRYQFEVGKNRFIQPKYINIH